jgi:hypothetical protein
MSAKLSLNENLERQPNPGHDNLRAFGVQVAAEPLKMSAEKEHVPPEVFLDKSRIRWREHVGGDALGVQLRQVGKAIMLPTK